MVPLMDVRRFRDRPLPSVSLGWPSVGNEFCGGARPRDTLSRRLRGGCDRAAAFFSSPAAAGECEGNSWLLKVWCAWFECMACSNGGGAGVPAENGATCKFA